MKQFQLYFLLPLLLTNCIDKRTYLTDEIKAVNPYEQGQKLIFVSTTGLTNTLLITGVEDNRFPDGLGAPSNEILHVIAYRESKTIRDGTAEFIFSFWAKWKQQEEQILFEISLKDAAMYGHSLSFSEFQKLEPSMLKTEFLELSDVLVIDLPPKVRQDDRTFKQISWSKSIGYVQMVQNDGTIWNLKEITNR
jgi:hypothetical protein